MKAKNKLALLVFVLVLVKSFLSFFVVSPTIFNDEMLYMRMAANIVHGDFFLPHALHVYPPLYSLLISPAMLISDISFSYLLVKIINAFLSSLVVIPSYLIARWYLEERESFLVAALIGVLPFNFSFSPYVMSENLSYTVVLFTFYFLLRSFKTEKYRDNIMCGLFLSLSYLTRGGNIALFPLVIISPAIFILSGKSKLKYELCRKLFLIFISLLILFPWFLSNFLTYGFGLQTFLGSYSIEAELLPRFSVPSFIYWIMAYIGYIIAASFFILFLYFIIFIYKESEMVKWLSLMFLLFFIIIAAYHGGISGLSNAFFLKGRPLGRYIAPAIMIMVLFGSIQLFREQRMFSYKVKFIYWLAIIPFLFLLLIFNMNHFFPANNIHLSYIGLFNRVFFGNFIFFLVLPLILPLFFLLILNTRRNTLVSLLFIFFIAVSLLSFSMTVYHSHTKWKSSDVRQAGLWFNKKEGSVFILYKPADRTLLHSLFWIRNKFSLEGSPENFDYVLTKENLDLELMAQFGDIKIYRGK